MNNFQFFKFFLFVIFILTFYRLINYRYKFIKESSLFIVFKIIIYIRRSFFFLRALIIYVTSVFYILNRIDFSLTSHFFNITRLSLTYFDKDIRTYINVFFLYT